MYKNNWGPVMQIRKNNYQIHFLIKKVHGKEILDVQAGDGGNK